MEPLSDEQLDEIETRANAAPEGPWVLRCENPSGVTWTVRRQPFADGTPGNMLMSGHKPECEFVAHARTDVPALVAEVRQLRQDNATLYGLAKQCLRAEQGLSEYRQLYQRSVAASDKEITDLKLELEHLRKYADHEIWCARGTGAACNCGFEVPE